MNIYEGTIFLVGVGVLALSGCTATPEPICDREAVPWDKWGTVDMAPECTARPKARPVFIPGLGENDDPIDPMMPPESPAVSSEGPGPTPPNESPRPEPNPSRIGNPGNDKDVGKAGEKPEKGMAEQGGVKGNRGRSN